MSIPSQPTVQPFFGIRRAQKPFFLTEFLNAYVGTRTDLMRREYATWLKQTDPVEKARIAARMAEIAGRLETERIKAERDIIAGRYDLAGIIARGSFNVDAARLAAESRVQAAGIAGSASTFGSSVDLQRTREEGALISPEGEASLNQYVPNAARRIADIIASYDTADPEQKAAAEKAMQNEYARTAQHIAAVASRESPLAGATIRRHVSALLDGIVQGALEKSESNAQVVGEMVAAVHAQVFAGLPIQESPLKSIQEIAAESPKYGGASYPGGPEAIARLGQEQPWIMDLARQPQEIRTSTTTSGALPFGTVAIQTPQGEPGAQAAPQVVPGVQVVPTPPAGYVPSTQAGGVTYYVPQEYTARAAVPAPDAGSGALSAAAQTMESGTPGGRMDVYSEDRTGKTWDYGPRTFFEKQAPGVDEVLARMVALKKSNPAKYDRFRDLLAAQNQRATRKEGREIEQRLEKVQTAAEKVDVPGGAPATRPPYVSDYGPGRFDNKAQALAALYGQGQMTGKSPEEQAWILADLDKQWPTLAETATPEQVAALEHARTQTLLTADASGSYVSGERVRPPLQMRAPALSAPPTPQEQREAYEEIVNAPADVRALETARTRVATETEPSLLAQFPQGTPIPYNRPTVEPSLPPTPRPAAVASTEPPPGWFPMTEEAGRNLSQAKAEDLQRQWEELPDDDKRAAVAALSAQTPTPPPGTDVTPAEVAIAKKNAERNQARVDRLEAFGTPAPKKAEPEPRPLNSPALAAVEKAYMDRLAAKEKAKKPAADAVPDEYVSRATENADLNAPDKKDADEVQGDAAMVLAPVPEKKKKGKKHPSPWEGEEEEDTGTEE